jgi:hypothetical protein
MSSSDDALEKFVRWSNFHIPVRWTIFPSPSSGSLTNSREMRAEIDFVAVDRKWVRIWVSDKFMRSFSLDDCSEITVENDCVDLTLSDGERYLLVLEQPA